MDRDEERVFERLIEVVEVEKLPVFGWPSEAIKILPAVLGNAGPRLDLVEENAS